MIDLAPTILELAGGRWPATFAGKPVPPSPGKSLVPVFAKDGTVAHDYFWWFHDGNRAIRMGDWKLVAEHTNAWELYNVRADRSETTNLAASHSARVKKLERAWTRRYEEFRAVATKDLPPSPAGATGKPPQTGGGTKEIKKP